MKFYTSMLSLVLVIVTPLISNLAFEDARYSSISFDTNGGSSISPRDIKVGDRIEIPETTKEGFTFVDWYKDDSFVKPFNLTIMPARDFRIYAKWDADLYTIDFETNGGNSISSIQGYFGDSIPLPNNPTRLGYTFQGWYRDSNYNNYFNLSSFPSMNMTLYAKWLVNQYTITFNTNGGNSIQTQTKNYNASLSIPTPTKVGHSFAGWFTDVGLTQAFTLTNMPAQSITLYAKWTINQYTITFETNGGSSIASITGNYGDPVTAPSNPTRIEAIFAGWYANAILTQNTTIPTTIPSQNITVYAKWTINQYTITFNTNGGNSIQTQTNNYNSSLSIPTPTRVGHSFAGWYTDVGFTQAFTLTNMPAQNLTLYAKWTINQYTITFNTNGGNNLASITGNYGDPVTAPSNPTREGYTFNGWFANASLTQSTSIPTTIPSQNLTLYAKWEEVIVIASLGVVHSSVLSETGHVFIWGGNQNGQIGDGTTTDKNVPTEITSRFSLKDNDKITFLDLGPYHSSALSGTGRVFMWGWNYYGQIGDGTTIDRIVPTEITSMFSLNENDKIISLSLGNPHSSALSAAGRVFMWGGNQNGYLGDGTTIDRNVPTEITSMFSLTEGDKITSVSLGHHHSSALSLTGRVFMWGYHIYGQLGGSSNPYTPTEITARFSFNNGDRIISISLGGFHSSALSHNGRVFMWGSNRNGLAWGAGGGQLGDGSYQDKFFPTEITSRFALTEGDKIISLYLGQYHSSARSFNGEVFIWGYNESNIPKNITTIFQLYENEKIILLSLGGFYYPFNDSGNYGYHFSALTSFGRLFMWGGNTVGQLGDITNTDKPLPVIVKFLETLTETP